WFVGFSADIACAVWTGFDDGAPLGVSEAGATAALPAFVDLMRAAHKDRPATPVHEPSGVTHKKIDPETGLLAYEGEEHAVDEVFLSGTEPTEVAAPDAGTDGGTDDENDAGAQELPLLPAKAP